MLKLKALAIPALGVTFVTTVYATPVVSVGGHSTTSWVVAVNEGSVIPVNGPLTGPATAYYNRQTAALGLSGFEEEIAKITPDVPVSAGSKTKSALVLSWMQPSNPYTLGVTGYEYFYHADPDLTGYKVPFSALAPVGVHDLGVELIDANGKAEGWFTSVLTNGSWIGSYKVNLAMQRSQVPFVFIKDPGFTTKNVLWIRFDEASLPANPFSVPDPTGNGGAWNAFGQINATPGPEAFLPLLAGLAKVALGRRRSRNVG